MRRRRSELIIQSAQHNDSGQYECRAKNKVTRPTVSQFVWVDVPRKYSSQPIDKYEQPNNTTSEHPVVVVLTACDVTSRVLACLVCRCPKINWQTIVPSGFSGSMDTDARRRRVDDDGA